MKKAISMLMVTFLLFGCMPIASAAVDASSISEVTAFSIAEHHIASLLLLGDSEDIGAWHWGMFLCRAVPMYDANDNVSSYYLACKNNNGDDIGYVVVGANTDYAPIIEYATGGQFQAVQLAEKLALNSKKSASAMDIYYDGSVSYFIRTGAEKFASIQNGSIEECSRSQLAAHAITVSYAAEWVLWGPLIAQSKGSNPPTSGSDISNPDSYETGYSKKTSVSVPSSTGFSFSIVGDFAGTNHCAPLAATNLMKYYFYKDSRYSALRYNSTNSWSPTITRLYTDMQTNVGGSGTTFDNARIGLQTYISDRGYTRTVTQSTYVTISNMTAEIDSGYPFIAHYYSHYLYGDHVMFALGYTTYTHGTSITSTYIKVADGFNTSARYVHGAVGSSFRSMTKVRISY